MGLKLDLPEEEKIKEIMDGYDSIFKTLIMPVTFLSMLTWSYYFFVGNILAQEQLSETLHN